MPLLRSLALIRVRAAPTDSARCRYDRDGRKTSDRQVDMYIKTEGSVVHDIASWSLSTCWGGGVRGSLGGSSNLTRTLFPGTPAPASQSANRPVHHPSHPQWQRTEHGNGLMLQQVHRATIPPRTTSRNTRVSASPGPLAHCGRGFLNSCIHATRCELRQPMMMCEWILPGAVFVGSLDKEAPANAAHSQSPHCLPGIAMHVLRCCGF